MTGKGGAGSRRTCSMAISRWKILFSTLFTMVSRFRARSNMPMTTFVSVSSPACLVNQTRPRTLRNTTSTITSRATTTLSSTTMPRRLGKPRRGCDECCAPSTCPIQTGSAATMTRDRCQPGTCWRRRASTRHVRGCRFMSLPARCSTASSCTLIPSTMEGRRSRSKRTTTQNAINSSNRSN